MLSTRIWLLLPVAILAVFALAINGCSDSGSDPGTGGGSVSGPTLAAGSYDVTFRTWTCGQQDTVSVSLSQVACSALPWSELLDIDCAPTVDGTSMTINCTFTEDNGFCEVTRKVTGSGTLTGDTWTINGKIEILSENPPACDGDPPCVEAIITVTNTGPAPSACQYAAANTIETTIGGGPLAGSLTFENVSGLPTPSGGNFFWQLSGFYSSTYSTVSPVSSTNISEIFFLTPVISGTLPQTFSVAMFSGPAAASASAVDVFMGYSEFYLTEGSFFGESVQSGSFTVNEADGDHIAGSFDVTVLGTEFDPQTQQSVQTTRSIRGGYFVTGDPIPPVPSLTDVQVERPTGLREWIRIADERR